MDSDYYTSNPYSVGNILEKMANINVNESTNEEKRFLNLKNLKVSHLPKLRSSKMTVRCLREMIEEEDRRTAESIKNTTPGYVEPEYILELSKNMHRVADENITEYIASHKKILLTEHAIMMKRLDIKRMEDFAEELEAEVLRDELKLEKDALNFSEFIKSMNTLSNDAMKWAFEETKIKMVKMEEVRKLNSEIFLIKSDTAKLESLLTEYLICTHFLEAAYPQTYKEYEKIGSTVQEISESPKTTGSIFLTESMEPFEVPFRDETSLLKSINHFRDQNLNIISNNHYIIKTLTEIQRTYNAQDKEMNEEYNKFYDKIKELEEKIENNKNKMVKFTNLTAETVQKSEARETQCQNTIVPKIITIYEMCTGIKAGRMGFTMMIISIESFLSNLLLEIRQLPEKSLHNAYMLKRLERKNKQNKEEEALRLQIQKDRIAKSDRLQFNPPSVKLKRRMEYKPLIKQKVVKEKSTSKEIIKPDEDDDTFFFV